MAWMICGTVPDASFPLVEGRWRLEGGLLHAEAGGVPPLPGRRGTPAPLGTALLGCEALGAEPPRALLAGDIGDGDGSRRLYGHLAASLKDARVEGLTFHYLFPDVDGHNRVLMALEDMDPKPTLVADAGFMYVAKMSGYADAYDLFTPDAGELAFLADEKAPHPFYTRGFLLAGDADVPELAARAHRHGNAARFLLVKGRTDRLVREGRVVGEVDGPQVPALEPIGGTGDVVTGLVTGLLASGMDMTRACLTAARAGRLAGLRAKPTPATQVGELLPFLPAALREALESPAGEAAQSPSRPPLR